MIALAASYSHGPGDHLPEYLIRYLLLRPLICSAGAKKREIGDCRRHMRRSPCAKCRPWAVNSVHKRSSVTL
jgi:hypothetical protein